MRILLLIIIPIFISVACSNTEDHQHPVSKTDEKIEFYTNKIEIDPKAYSYYNKLAQAYIQKARESGDPEYYLEAKSSISFSLKLSPDNYIGLVYMAMVYSSQHKFNEALNYAKRAIQVNPDAGYAYGVLGDAYLELGQLQKADRAYNKMAQIDPGLDSYSRLSNLSFKKHDITGAINAMEKAYEYGVKNARTSKANLAWTQAMLGNIYLHEGDKLQAEEYFENALEIMPEYYLAQGHNEVTHTHNH